MGIGSKCSRRVCSEVATRKRSLTTFYCDFHYRLSVMSQNSKVDRGDELTFRAVEALYKAQGKPEFCPHCKRAFTWHSDESGLGTVISLQHNNDGSLSFLCYSCNTGHGHSHLGDEYLKLDPSVEKYCPACKKVKPLTDFSSNCCNLSGLSGWCRKCDVSKKAARRARVL